MLKSQQDVDYTTDPRFLNHLQISDRARYRNFHGL